MMKTHIYNKKILSSIMEINKSEMPKYSFMAVRYQSDKVNECRICANFL